MVLNFLKFIPSIPTICQHHYNSGCNVSYLLFLLFQKTIKNTIWNNFLTKIIGVIFHQFLDFGVVFNKLYRVSLDEAQAVIKIAGRNTITSHMQMTAPLWQKVKRN